MNGVDNHSEMMFMLGEIRSDIKSIKEQTTKTNGRVMKAEEAISTLINENEVRKNESKILKSIGGGVWGLVASGTLLLVEHFIKK